MGTDQVKRLLQVFAAGKKLDKTAVTELYLSGYIGIQIPSVGKEPVPTTITPKGDLVLKGQ